MNMTVACETAFTELNSRIPARYFASADVSRFENYVGTIDTSTFFQRATRRPDRCFRAVVDDFVTAEEADRLEAMLEPVLAGSRPADFEQQVATAEWDDLEDTIVPNVDELVQQGLGRDAKLASATALLKEVTAKVRALLIDGFGAPESIRTTKPFIIARSSVQLKLPQARAFELAQERLRAFSSGALSRSSLPKRQWMPHFDAAWLPEVAYTLLLYLPPAEHTVAGGETLFVDSFAGGTVGRARSSRRAAPAPPSTRAGRRTSTSAREAITATGRSCSGSFSAREGRTRLRWLSEHPAVNIAHGPPRSWNVDAV